MWMSEGAAGEGVVEEVIDEGRGVGDTGGGGQGGNCTGEWGILNGEF